MRNYTDVLMDCSILGEGGIFLKSHKITIPNYLSFLGLREPSKKRIFNPYLPQSIEMKDTEKFFFEIKVDKN